MADNLVTDWTVQGDDDETATVEVLLAELKKFILDNNLVDYTDKIIDLGATCVRHLQHLDLSDLVEIGVPRLQARAFMREVKSVFEQVAAASAASATPVAAADAPKQGGKGKEREQGCSKCNEGKVPSKNCGFNGCNKCEAGKKIMVQIIISLRAKVKALESDRSSHSHPRDTRPRPQGRDRDHDHRHREDRHPFGCKCADCAHPFGCKCDKCARR